jgi:two-component system, LytTR family, response regulator AlgR
VTALRTLIVDDEPLAVERLQILCGRLENLLLVGTANDGRSAQRLIAALAPDLLLLDISMPGLDGLALARALAESPVRPAIIFVTAFNEFAVAAFDVAATDYLLKPVAQERLERAIGRVHAQLAMAPAAREAASPYTREFWVPHRAEIIRVAVADIDLIEAERDYMRLHIGPRSYLLHQTITELERCLDPDLFVRLHRSTIVPRSRIARLRHDGAGIWEAVLSDGRALRIGRTYLPRAKEIIGKPMEQVTHGRDAGVGAKAQF